MHAELSIGELSDRSGVTTSALRFYEAEGLIHAERSPGGQRRYHRDALRRVAFVRIAQHVGLSLEEIHEALATLPESRTPTAGRAAAPAPGSARRSAVATRRTAAPSPSASACIGCGCLSLRVCHLVNADDRAGERGPGPRYVLED